MFAQTVLVINVSRQCLLQKWIIVIETSYLTVLFYTVSICECYSTCTISLPYTTILVVVYTGPSRSEDVWRHVEDITRTTNHRAHLCQYWTISSSITSFIVVALLNYQEIVFYFTYIFVPSFVLYQLIFYKLSVSNCYVTVNELFIIKKKPALNHYKNIK